MKIDNYRVNMERASMILVALEKIEWNNENLRNNLEEILHSLLSVNPLDENDSNDIITHEQEI